MQILKELLKHFNITVFIYAVTHVISNITLIKQSINTSKLRIIRILSHPGQISTCQKD